MFSPAVQLMTDIRDHHAVQAAQKAPSPPYLLVSTTKSTFKAEVFQDRENLDLAAPSKYTWSKKVGGDASQGKKEVAGDIKAIARCGQLVY